MTINNLRDSANGTFVTLDDYLLLTGYEPNAIEFTNATELNDEVSSDFIDFQNSPVHIAPSSDHYMDDDTLGKLLAEVHRDYADYRRPEGVNVSPSSMSVMVDRTGGPVERSDIDLFGFSVRNVKSAQNQFPVITQAERMVDRTGKPVEEMIAEERESSSAQIRTLFNEQRKTIIAECCEKVSHHELQAARAEQERKILQGELWRQQQDFREVHQQNLTEMKELQKFQNSTFDELTRQKFIEDQNTIMELSGRLQELQNEVNCMNDSKDFQDAESVRSGNSHVTSQPGVFPKHPPFEGLLRPSFVSPRHTDGPPNIWDTPGISGNVFAHPQASSSAPYPQELNSTWRRTIEEPRIASALNKIIHNSQFKRRISLEEQKAQTEDRFLRGRQIAYMIYDQFRVTGTHDSVENYTDLFTIVLRNDDIQEFDSKWDGVLLSMTKIPHDDILEGLYKLRIRESEKLKTVARGVPKACGQQAAADSRGSRTCMCAITFF